MLDNHMGCLLAFWCLIDFDSPFKTVEGLPVQKIVPLAVPSYCKCFWFQVLSAKLKETFWSGFFSHGLVAPSVCIGKADIQNIKPLWGGQVWAWVSGRKGLLGDNGLPAPFFPWELMHNSWTRWKLCFPLSVCMVCVSWIIVKVTYYATVSILAC